MWFLFLLKKVDQLKNALQLIKKSIVEKKLLTHEELIHIKQVSKKITSQIVEQIVSKKLPEQDVVAFSDLLKNIEKNEKIFYSNLLKQKVFGFKPYASFNVISSFFHGRFVFLGLKLDEKIFYIVQYLNCPVGVISTHDELAYYDTGYTNVSAVNVVTSFLNAWLNDANASLEYEKSDNRLSGLMITTDDRPSHFFYEFLPVLYQQDISENLINFDMFLYRKNSKFLSISDIFFLNTEELSASDLDIQNKVFSEKIIAIEPGFRKFRGYPELIPITDNHLRRRYKSNSLENYYPVIWFSLLAEEKSWVEQNKTISNLIKKFLSTYSNPLILFDGLTLQLDLKSTEQFNRNTVQIIKDSVGKPFNYIDMHGHTSMQKVELATQCHIFLTSMGSDSLYPSRIAGKPGVVHCSPDTSMFKKHKYSEKTIKADPLNATFLPSQEHLRADKRSYSIPSDYIENLVWQCWRDSIST